VFAAFVMLGVAIGVSSVATAADAAATTAVVQR
jgi:hypothetical protein